MTKRKYRGTDMQMLLASGQIAEFGITYEQQLSARRPQWKAPFFQNLKERITQTSRTRIGLDNLPSIMEATEVVNGIITIAHRGIMELKAEIEVNFRSNPTRRSVLLTELGYDKLPKKYISQSQYVQLLATLRANLTPAVKAELVAVGANPATIDTLLLQAHRLIEANGRQESLKVNRKSLTAENIAEFNAIYDEVSTVCKLVAACFTDDKRLVERFCFTKTLRSYGYVRPSKKKKAPADTPNQVANGSSAPHPPTSAVDTASTVAETTSAMAETKSAVDEA
ncbi:hypothetical protein [uncultured Acetobacteroides sp.]|uniref:hypothetical protein n=1 Tax=uncultured Acetobacteroides sp. TaxID=1760811 RepID=UPI0029F4DE79|nr:hypothetical protein [uncultured Acetobacteroides sp.]